MTPPLRSLAVTFSVAIAGLACGSKSTPDNKDAQDEDNQDRDGEARRSGMPEACKRKAPPSSTDLGLEPERFIECVEKVLATMNVPDEVKQPFEKVGEGSYAIGEYMSVTMQVEGGSIASMDVLFFPALREAHGMNPELAGQYATLAIVVPSAEVDPRKGKSIFDEIDAIGRKTNKAIIDLDRDGVHVNASFLPVSVRYRFTPTPG